MELCFLPQWTASTEKDDAAFHMGSNSFHNPATVELYPFMEIQCLTFVCICAGEHQHSRQCVPDVGLFQGAPPLRPSELHPSCTDVHVWPATKSLGQPAGVLQVSTFKHLSHLDLTFIKVKEINKQWCVPEEQDTAVH